MAKVAVVQCENYEKEMVFNAVKRAVDLLGGIEAVVKIGMRVLIKPNLLSERPPEDAVDTHPEVIRAVVRLVRDAEGIPLIGDSPGGYGKNIEEVYEKSGVRDMAEEEGAELLRFKSSKFVDGMPITRYVFDCDRIISVPKLKTHSITVLTAAIKNMFGTVTGLHKAECHSRSPKDKDFAKVIAKVYSISKPHLTVLDGIVGMEGDGPSAGNPRKINLVMASEDGVAVDACVAKIVGLEPLDVHVTKEAYNMGLGEADPHKIEILGDNLTDFIVTDFKLPQTAFLLRLIPTRIAEGIAAYVRFKPDIDPQVCRRCNLCKITCAVGAIEIKNGHCGIDYGKCIRCLCCHEICPYSAIYIRRNILTRFIWG